MRPSSRLAMLAAGALVVAACAGGTGATARQSPESSSAGSSTAAWLSATPFKAAPPLSRFASGPTAVITADGTYVTAAAVDARTPAPLVPPLVGRALSDGGRATIKAEAVRLGLLGRKRDFRSVIALPGSVIGRLQLTGDDGPVTLVGEPDSKLLCVPQFCDPLPGTRRRSGSCGARSSIRCPGSAASWDPRPRSSQPPTRSSSGLRRPLIRPPVPLNRRLAAGGAARDLRRPGRQGLAAVRDRERCGRGGAPSGARGRQPADAMGPGSRDEWHVRDHGAAGHRRRRPLRRDVRRLTVVLRTDLSSQGR